MDEVNLENVKIEETVADIDYPQEEEIKVEEIPPVDENVVDEVKVTKQETVSSTSNDVVKKKKKYVPQSSNFAYSIKYSIFYRRVLIIDLVERFVCATCAVKITIQRVVFDTI